ncbi:MAG: IS1595 family transposase [Marinifilaceae bacterium]|jgi:transposase-like protein|nr:IS1595 family transposase [Marinifilaceae bacterium]
MEYNILKNLLEEVKNLNNLQFRLLKEEVDRRLRNKRISHILESHIEDLICPYCNNNRFIRWGKRSDLQRYKCKNCSKTFNCLTKTPLARLRKKGRWLNYTKCLKAGQTVRKAASDTGVHRNTSFRWRHRFLSNSKFIKAKKIGGIVESGYIKLRESFKGIRDETIHKKKKKDVHVVFGIDRNNNIFDITNKGFSLKTLNCNLSKTLLNKSLLITQKDKVFSDFARKGKYNHGICSNKGDKLVYLSKVESYQSRFISWINDHFKGVATKYLENYVSWYRALNEFKSGINALTLLYRAKLVEKYRHQPLKVTRFL